jgi:hypothetical protein
MAIAVEFIGICTHIDKRGAKNLPYERRVILVNAENPPDNIDPHFASVTIHKPDGTEINLGKGIKLRFDPPGQGLEHLRWDKLPRLGVLNGTWAVSDDVLYHGNAAVHFDINAGVFTTVCQAKATGTELIIPGEKPPTLIAAPITGGEEKRHELPSGTIIRVQNVSTSSRPDDESHFKLHYLIGGRPLPAEPKMHKTPCSAFGIPDLPSLGAGCSNSGWP